MKPTVNSPTSSDINSAALKLTHLASGAMARVTEVGAEGVDALRLKSLGICQGRRIQLLKGGDPLVVRALGARVGISKRLARGVFVEPL